MCLCSLSKPKPQQVLLYSPPLCSWCLQIPAPSCSVLAFCASPVNYTIKCQMLQTTNLKQLQKLKLLLYSLFQNQIKILMDLQFQNRKKNLCQKEHCLVLIHTIWKPIFSGIKAICRQNRWNLFFLNVPKPYIQSLTSLWTQIPDFLTVGQQKWQVAEVTSCWPH